MCYSSFYQYANEENKKKPLIPKQQEIFEQQEALIAQTKLNKLALKSKKEETTNSLGLLVIDKDENFFNQDKDN